MTFERPNGRIIGEVPHWMLDAEGAYDPEQRKRLDSLLAVLPEELKGSPRVAMVRPTLEGRWGPRGPWRTVPVDLLSDAELQAVMEAGGVPVRIDG
jgi:hypothetical protein